MKYRIVQIAKRGYEIQYKSFWTWQTYSFRRSKQPFKDIPYTFDDLDIAKKELKSLIETHKNIDELNSFKPMVVHEEST